MKSVLRSIPISAATKKIDELWHAYDADKNGVLDRKEAKLFITEAFQKKKGQSWISDDAFEVLFDTLDLDDSGTIEKQELMKVFESVLSGKGNVVTQRLVEKIEQQEKGLGGAFNKPAAEEVLHKLNTAM